MWHLLSLSEEGGGGIVLAYPGWHTTWTVMMLCVITIILFWCGVSEVVGVDVEDNGCDGRAERVGDAVLLMFGWSWEVIMPLPFVV